MPQFVTLAFLSRQGDAKMTDMAHHMNVTTAAMTGVIDRLARDGYVSRGHDPKDRRVVKVKVTAKGSRLVERLSRERRKALMNMFGKISQEEREKYLEILTHIKEHLTAPEKT
jgi:DNA-binding MarR family transcriptional regulator